MSIEHHFLKRLAGRRVILFGASGGLTPVLEKIKDVCRVAYIVDNDAAKWNTDFLGYPVCAPQKLLSKGADDVVIICSWWKQSISRQLISYGLKPNEDFFIDSALTIDPSHYFEIFELYAGFLQRQGLDLDLKSVLHLGVGHTLMVDMLLAMAGARVCSCNLENEMIFFPDASLKYHLYQTLPDYYRKNARLFIYKPEAILKFGKNSLSFTSDKVAFLTLNAEQLPFGDNSFDYVFSYDLFEHLRSPEAVIGEQNRVLKPGGSYYHHISPSEHRPNEAPFDLYTYSQRQWSQICKGLGYFHNRWLTCQYVDAFSKGGALQAIDIHAGVNAKGIVLDAERLDPAFRRFPAQAFTDSRGYVRIGGTI